jgi:hypothetical protein
MNPDAKNDVVFKWASNINVGYIIRFHEFILNELRRKEDELNYAIANFTGERKQVIDLLVERDLYSTTYKQHLMNNTFLLLYSHLEEWLFHIQKTYAKSMEIGKPSRGSISRFIPVIRHTVGSDVLADETCQFLVEAERVRNCLLHANARIDLSRDSQQLRKLVKKSNGDLSENNLRLCVHQAYLNKFFACIQRIILRVKTASE